MAERQGTGLKTMSGRQQREKAKDGDGRLGALGAAVRQMPGIMAHREYRDYVEEKYGKLVEVKEVEAENG